MDKCDVCGFDFGDYGHDDVVGGVAAASVATAGLLRETDRSALHTRPEPARWSAVEYAAHIRDVLLTIRDRLVIGLVEDDPEFKSMHSEERVDLGLYTTDTPAEVANELEAASGMFVRLFAAIDPGALERSVQYGQPDPQPRTLLWMGLQAVHESERHLDDIRQNIERLQSG